MKKILAVLALLTALPASLCAFTTGSVPTDGVYKFTFGVSEAEGFAVPATAVYDVQGTGYYTGETPTFSYGFLGTTADSYKDDVPNRSKVVDPRQIDGFSVVEGQYIVLSNATDLASRPCVAGPAAADYIPATASSYEGRYPVRFAMRGEERAYYVVTATVANASSTANADITLYSERSHLIAHHMALAPGQTRTFSWSVELAPNLSKSVSDYYYDDTINVIVVGENAALASVTVVKQGQAAGTIRGTYHESGVNTNKTLWICTDSTGCDYPIAVPFCSLQNYGGVGAGLSRWAPSDLSIRNQGEGGLGMGSHSHRTTCQLKAGDYLYVEYGHNDNESSFLNNIGAYLADAKAAGAYLIIVSPVERHTSWDSTTGYWKASLGWARDLGRNWVEDQIVNSNETCVAFVDLNTHYLNWMNSEVDRICARFPDMNRSAAINYYYQSAKGKNVDGTHLNTAGEDQGAYAFWQAALAVVAAGDEADATDSEKAQANVIRGITTGYKSKLGDSDLDNVPWVVTDDIIELGVAPNSYWDTPVTTSLKYKNEAVVSSVAATTNADGTVSISGATMRILNPGNYYKAVYDIVSADGATTNRYWSYYNYDVGGINAASGTLINPEYPGFITEDRASGGSKDLDTLTIPAGGKAYVWIAKADDATWQVTTNAPCSAKYPVETWSRVLVDEDCTSATVPSDEWHVSTQAEWTLTPNVGGWLDFTGTGYATDGKTKKNFGLFRTFDETGAISGGRYRVSFKMLYTAGNIAFYVIKNIGETSNPTGGGVPLVQFTGKAATVFGSTDAEITIEEDNEGNEVASNRINVDAWTDVDMIVDMDLGTAQVSVGGSDYQTFTVPAYSTNEAIANTPYRYFAMSLAAQMSHFGSFDDIKIVQLAATSELPEVTVSVAANDDDLGAVATTATKLTQNGSVTLTATPNEGCVFLGWIDNESGETLSTDTTWNIARVHNNVAVTADFRVVWTAIASSADEAIGSVSVGGSSLTLPQYIAGDDIAFRAIPSDEDVYAFVNWADANDNVVTNAPFFKVQDANENLAYTANFREYGREENRTKLWDFAGYYGANVTHTEKTGSAYEYDGLTIYLSQNDTLTENGLYWGNVGSNKSGTNVGATGRHIEWTPSVSGTASVTFSVGSIDTGKNQYPEMFVVAGDADMATSGGYAHLKTAAKDTDYTLSFEVTAGTLYKIYTYYYNRSSTVTVKKIELTYAPTYYTVEASVNNASLGTAAVSTDKVLGGKSVTFTAKPVTGAYKFVNWTDDSNDDAVVSTEATYTTSITANTALTANFAALGAEDDCVLDYGFGPIASSPVDYSSATIVSNGCFAIQMVNGDSLSSSGAVWYKVAVDDKSALGTSLSANSDHYIKFTAPYDGTVKVVASVDSLSSKYTASLKIKAAETASECSNSGDANVNFIEANTNYELSLAVTAGTTYFVWAYSWNAGAGGYNPYITISSLTYTHASDPVTLTLAAGENGSVAINGVSGAGDYAVQKGEYVKLVATPDAYYGLGSWTDGEDNELATTETFWCCVSDNMTVTANFVAESTIDITRSADFTPFAEPHAITEQAEAWSQLVGRMEVHGAAGDTLTDDGIYWAGPAETDQNQSNTIGRYIKFECGTTGKLRITFKGDRRNGNSSNNNPRMYLTPDTSSQGVNCMTKNATGNVAATTSALDTDYDAEFDVTAGTTYYLWPYSYNNSGCKFWVSSISWPTAKSDYYTVTVNGEEQKVYHGDSIVLEAPATTETQIFTGWVDGNEESLGEGTSVLLTVTADTTATAAYRDPDAHSFVWNPAVAEGDWNDPLNWRYEGIIQATTYPSDSSQDVAVFNTAATVNLPAAAAVSNVIFNAAVTLTGNTLTAALVDGASPVTLSNAGFANPNNLAALISCPIVMAADTVNWFNKVADGDWKEYMTVSGNISGSGRYNVNIANVRGSAVHFTGDNNEFCGDVYTSGGTANRSVINWSENAVGTNTYLHIGHSYGNYNGDDYCMGADVKFGGVDGDWWDRYDNCLLTIGYLNRDSTINISNSVGDRANSVKKVGTANLKLGTTKIKNLTIEGGSVTMPIGIAPQTLTIATGTSITLAGDAAWTAGNTYDLFSYTTLAGTGEETLSSQVSVTGLASGLAAEISIADNTVKATIVNAAPTTDDESATIERDANTGAYSITTEAESLEITVPDGVTVSEVVVSTNTTTVTGVPSSAAVKVAVFWEGGSAQYAIVSVAANGAVTLNENAVVTVGSEEIPLKPVLSDATDDEKPLEVSSDSVAVGVKAIPGLVYRLNRATTPNGETSSVDTEKATSSRVSLTDNTKLPAAFYRISADLK